MAEIEGEHKEEASAANLDTLDNIPVDPSNTETVKDTVAPSPPPPAGSGAEVGSAPAAPSPPPAGSGAEVGSAPAAPSPPAAGSGVGEQAAAEAANAFVDTHVLP